MDDGSTGDQTEQFVPFEGEGGDDDAFGTAPESDPWPGAGARRSPRPAAEGVRIIGADEAAAAIESGQATRRNPEDVPRFGDVPEAPSEPRPPLRFPGADPAAVAKPPIAPPDARPSTGGPGVGGDDLRGEPARDSYVEESFWGDEPEGQAPGGQAQPGGDQWLAPEEWDGAGEERSRASSGNDPGALPGERSEPGGYSGLSGDFGGDRDTAMAGDRGQPEDSGEFGSSPPRRAGPDEVAVGGQGPGSSLPHWTEPPTGENPRILAGSEPEPGVEEDDDLKAWSTLSTGPRWRDHQTDWEEADFGGAAVLDDPEMRLGALRTEYPPEDEFAVEEAPPPAPAPVPGAGGRQGRARGPRGRGRGGSAPGGPQAGAVPVRGRRSAPGQVPGPAARSRNQAEPFGAEPGGAGPRPPGGGMRRQMGGRELQVRVVTGAVVLGILLLAAVVGPGALAFLVAVALTMAAAELFGAFRTHGYHPATLLGLAATASLVAVAYWRPLNQSDFLLVLVLLVVFSLLWYLAGVSHAAPIPNIGVTVFGVVYIGVLGSFAATILGFGEEGIGIILGAVLATAAYDTGAYFVGAWTGRTPLMPHISPGKTVEGLVGGTFAALAMSIIIVRMIHPWDGGKAFWLFVVVSAAAPLGDLCESMLKRELGVKDMGAVVPGHGGVLDRIDALLFVIPATYYMLRVVG